MHRPTVGAAGRGPPGHHRRGPGGDLRAARAEFLRRSKTPRPAAAVDDQVSRLSGGVRHKSLDKQPDCLLATAGLLAAAVAVLESPDLAGTIARHVQDRTTVRPSRSSWARVVERHRSACSPAMREAADSVTCAYRRTGGPGARTAPRLRPEPTPTAPSTFPRSWNSAGTTGTSRASATGRHHDAPDIIGL